MRHVNAPATASGALGASPGGTRGALRPRWTAALTLFVACAPDAPAAPGGLATTFDTIGGVVHVTNTGAPPPARLVRVVSIGPKTLTDTGSPDEFGGVNSVALGPDGEVYVADARNFEVRVFGLDGVHRRTFGREGEGPGEFQSLSSLAWAGDRLLTYDIMLGRVGQWSAEGEWLGSWRTRGMITGGGGFIRLYLVGPDELYRYAMGSVRETRFGATLQSLFVGLNSRGETGDTLVQLEAPSDAPASSITCQWGKGYLNVFGVPFAPSVVQHPGPDGVVYSALTSDYCIAVTRGADTVRVIHRPLPTEPVGDDEWEEGVREFNEWRAEHGSASCEPRSPSRPAAKPILQALHIAPDGRLWVEVERADGDLWEVFDPDGRLIASVPRTSGVFRAAPAFDTSDHLLTVRQDSLGLDHVDLWRLAWEDSR
ncbi:MAG: hypothetical protein J4F34_08950 [Gemmatimonadetes bacterium]|nr:hypothetical protein [Gemmatimonadota bacterium]